VSLLSGMGRITRSAGAGPEFNREDRDDHIVR
jgi:hypothetical protein